MCQGCLPLVSSQSSLTHSILSHTACSHECSDDGTHACVHGTQSTSATWAVCTLLHTACSVVKPQCCGRGVQSQNWHLVESRWRGQVIHTASVVVMQTA